MTTTNSLQPEVKNEVPPVSAASSSTVSKAGVRKVYLTLDAWRGLASLAVVCFHWSELVVRRWPELESNALYRVSHFGNIGVQVFFVISGYVIANAGAANLERRLGVKKFIFARVRRIYPTYWAGLLLSMLVMYLGFKLAQQGAVPQNIFTQINPFQQSWLSYIVNLTLTNFLLGPLNIELFLMVAWTLCYEMAFYLIVAGGIALSRSPQRMMFLLHGLSAASLVWLIVSPGTCPYPLNLWPQFGLGVLVYDYLSGRGTSDTQHTNKVTLVWITILTTLTMILVARQDFYINAWVSSSRLAYGVSLGFSFLLVVLSWHDTRLSRVRFIKLLGSLGIFSYSLYLTHTVTIRLVNQLMLRLQLPLSTHWIMFASAIGIATAAAYVFFLFFEKPLLRGGKHSSKPSVPNSVLPARDGVQPSEARGSAL